MVPNKTAHIQYAANKLWILAPYDADYVSQLKEGTRSRRWDPKGKKWTVALDEREKALEITRHFFEVVEDNQSLDPGKETPSVATVPLDIESGENITVWTDGACLINPGPGAYAAILSHKRGKTEKVGGYKLTTNNRMELMGAIVALEAISEDCPVTIYSDSEYLVNGMAKGWARNWAAKGWKRKGGSPVPNRDLWVRLLALSTRHKVKFVWIKGHAAQPENERCNDLAEAAAHQKDLPIDEGYEVAAAPPAP